MWGIKIDAKHYSSKAIDTLTHLIQDRRELFKKEYAHALKFQRDIYLGTRFKDDEKILWVLESKVDEYKFMLTPELYIDNVLLGAAEADYYYQFEKEF
jgi:hypothetical protein